MDLDDHMASARRMVRLVTPRSPTLELMSYAEGRLKELEEVSEFDEVLADLDPPPILRE